MVFELIPTGNKNWVLDQVWGHLPLQECYKDLDGHHNAEGFSLALKPRPWRGLTFPPV
jgi:hypothetical protein